MPRGLVAPQNMGHQSYDVWTMYNDILFATTSLAFTELHALPVMAQNAHA